MANEINLQGTLTLQRSTLNVQAVGNKTQNQTGTNGMLNVQQVTTTGGALSTGNVPTSGDYYIFVNNLDTANYVELSINSGLTQIFAKLKAGEFCLLPVPANVICYGKANTASVYVQVAAIQA